MVHLFQLFLHQLLSGTAVSFNEYIYKYIRQKINQTPLAILNYNLSFELLEDTFVSNDINMMLNSFLNKIFQTFSWHHQRIHKMRSSKRVIGGITFPMLTLSNLKKEFCLLAYNYNYLILNEHCKSICKTLEYIMVAKKKLILINKFIIPRIN